MWCLFNLIIKITVLLTKTSLYFPSCPIPTQSQFWRNLRNFLTCCSSVCVCVCVCQWRWTGAVLLLLIQWNSRERNLFSNTLLSLFTFLQYFCIKQHPLLGLQLIFLCTSKFYWCNASMLYVCRNKKSDYYQKVEEIFMVEYYASKKNVLLFSLFPYHIFSRKNQKYSKMI